MKVPCFFLHAILIATSLFSVSATEYFVSKEGNDAHDGKSRSAAFLTIQKGVDALQPGDTLTIAPGEYAENVRRAHLGDMHADTTIRAELPGTVVLRGDVAMDGKKFEKVEGFRFVYQMPFDREIQGINEVDTLVRMGSVSTLASLEFQRGAWYYDAEKKVLYISPSDMRPPAEHVYTLPVIPATGLLLLSPRRVIVDGLAVTGFQSRDIRPYSAAEGTSVWAIMLAHARQCVIRNCTAWLNAGGIAYRSERDKKDEKDDLEAGWNLIEKCMAFANGSIFGAEGGNILGFSSHHDEIRDCYAFLGYPNNIRFYGLGIRGPAVLKNSIAWGATYADIFLKGGQAAKYARAENTVTLGIFHAANLSHSIVGTIDQYNRKPGKDVIYGMFDPLGDGESAEKKAALRDAWFADPLNLDFHLQATSPMRGTGPDGTDRGVFPYKPNIFYVSTKGRDDNDGLSIKRPFRDLAKTMGNLRPGDTLYILEGTYQLPETLKITSSKNEKVSVRARGNARVVLKGNLEVSDTNGLEFERVHFMDSLTLENCRAVVLNNCRFFSQSTPLHLKNVEDIKITHCEFTRFEDPALDIQKSTRIWLSGNLFDNQKAPALNLDASENSVLYSDYNSYSLAEGVWRIAGEKISFSDLKKNHDMHSQIQPAEFVVENDLPVLKNAHAFDARGPFGSRIGFYRTFQPRALRVSEVHLHSVTDSTANLEWHTEVPSTLTLAWGETPEMTQRVLVNNNISDLPDGFVSVSLTGLKPGTKYFYQLIEARPYKHQYAQYILPAQLPDAPSTFTTADAPAVSRTLYVAPDGDNARTGLSRDEAWQTVIFAADQARPGDTIIISGGLYQGTVYVRTSGTAKSPIIFKAAPGERVIFDGSKRSVRMAFSVSNKEYIHFEGFYFQDYASGGWCSVMDLRESNHIKVENCFFNAYGPGTPGVQMRLASCTDVRIQNCVITRGFQGIYMRDSHEIQILNNVFLNNLICAILNSGGNEGDIVIRNNIFVDNIPSKVTVPLFEVGGFKQYVLENNAFYLRIPKEERKVFMFYGGGEEPRRLTLPEYEKQSGYKNLVVDNPHFVLAEGKEPPVNREGKKVEFIGDWLPRRDMQLSDLISTSPELKERGIGLKIPNDRD